IDYGLGNIRAFSNVYKRLNIAHCIIASASDFGEVTKLILPGVGAFDHAMESFIQSGLRDAVDECVLEKGMPVLGICVGMQIMARSSEEGSSAGLGWIDADVKRLDVSLLQHKTHLPHMGWNTITPRGESSLLAMLDDERRFYFLHSYYFSCDHEENILAEAEYGMKFTCAVQAENVYGVQFHPEKSHGNGIQVLKNFACL
ncbi:MAG: imidazole glycerol phosphate synthase subunit HisH, partial [Negativicutes bacterium]|nr:imidazole glycerol phosphate synthase subunit HisH [Negativicutes bacterium]